MTNPAHLIKTSIQDELGKQIDRRDSLSKSIADLQQQKAGVEMVIRSLQSILAQSNGSPAPVNQPANGQVRGNTTRPAVRGKTTTAILNYLRAQGSNGATRDSVIDSLIGGITTKSADPRRLMVNTLLNLKRDGVIAEKNGRYIVPL